jgi:hypothetical protein
MALRIVRECTRLCRFSLARKSEVDKTLRNKPPVNKSTETAGVNRSDLRPSRSQAASAGRHDFLLPTFPKERIISPHALREDWPHQDATVEIRVIAIHAEECSSGKIQLLVCTHLGQQFQVGVYFFGAHPKTHED